MVDAVLFAELQTLCRRSFPSRLDQSIAQIICLPWDAATGLRWARLLADLRHHGLAMPVKDSMIAATALHHHLPVATRNVRDFAKTKIEVINPFE